MIHEGVAELDTNKEPYVHDGLQVIESDFEPRPVQRSFTAASTWLSSSAPEPLHPSQDEYTPTKRLATICGLRKPVFYLLLAVLSLVLVVASLGAVLGYALHKGKHESSVTHNSPSPPVTTATSRVLSSTPDMSCGNYPGLQFALQDNPYNDTVTTYYDSFRANYFKTDAPIITGNTTSIGLKSMFDPLTSLYGVPVTENQTSHSAIHCHGYLYPRTSGNYEFSAEAVNGISLLWVGQIALSGFNRSNANQEYKNDDDPKTYTFSATEGVPVPIRVLYGYGLDENALKFRYHINAPDGNIIMDHATTDTRGYIVDRVCGDYKEYPDFKPFGRDDT